MRGWGCSPPPQPGASSPLTCIRKRSASAALPAATHWKVAFCPAFTSTSPRREKWGALAAEGHKGRVRKLSSAPNPCCSPQTRPGGDELGAGSFLRAPDGLRSIFMAQ